MSTHQSTYACASNQETYTDVPFSTPFASLVQLSQSKAFYKPYIWCIILLPVLSELFLNAYTNSVLSPISLSTSFTPPSYS